jgi:short-subunit dehydrogenase
MARGLAAAGASVALVARGEAALLAVAAECEARGARVNTAPLDVQDAAALPAQVLAWDAADPVDCIIANAGISGGTRPDGAPEGHEAATAQVAVNLLGAINMVEPLLPPMRARGHGQVALVASIAAFRGLPDTPAYCASKAGLWAYGEALRAAHGPAGIAVTVAAPGFFSSTMSARYLGARPLEISAEAAAARLHRALLRRQARLVFPRGLAMLLNGLALLPAPLSDALARRIRIRIAPET